MRPPFLKGPTPRGTRALASALGVALGLVLTGPVLAGEAIPSEAEDQELFGVIETPPDRLVPRPSPADADERTPGQLFEAAMNELKAARFDQAQRLFEIFIARDPQHESADEARRHLGELYQRDREAAAIVEAPAGGAPPLANSSTAGTEAARPSPPPARRVAVPSPVGGTTESSFMLEAGDRVFFSARSAELGSRARAVLAAQARWLKRHPNLSAVIEGHADDAPLSAEELDVLAAERAQVVFNRLVEEGIAPQRMAIAPFGRAKPLATCPEPDCAAQNRRAITVLTPQRLSELPPMEGERRSSSP